MLNTSQLTKERLCVFISGYSKTPITKFLGTSPALLVANHTDKILYIIPVPLDQATIGDATICCSMVITHDDDSLLCSILPKATIDHDKQCAGPTLQSPCFKEAIERADFTVAPPTSVQTVVSQDTNQNSTSSLSSNSKNIAKVNALIIPSGWDAPSCFEDDTTQIIEFGTGLHFRDAQSPKGDVSKVILPCLFGAQLSGPVLLATGTTPLNVPFHDDVSLRKYYAQLKDVMVFVSDEMTDNARNLATTYRINALFCVHVTVTKEPENPDEVLKIMNTVNINAVTALAGPQSLIVISTGTKAYFYRGLANPALLNTSTLAFGADISDIIAEYCMNGIIDPRATRMINLDEENTVILPTSGQLVKPSDFQKLFEILPVNQIQSLEGYLAAAVPQLQVLMNQQDLQELSKALITTLQAKVSSFTGPLREKYVKFISQEYKMDNPESVKTKNNMLGELRNKTKEIQKALASAISSLSNMMSSQTTSKRAHDLQRLVRKAAIQNNVEATKSMTFDTLAGYLETYAEDMGVMFLNIVTVPYRELLSNLKKGALDASECCDLDKRVLYLEGLSAGVIITQSQNSHDGPLRNQSGPMQPIMALPYLSQGRGSGSMLAWVCWDEFVNLESPYTVRWMEKCNEAHIAALRIIMRSTLSQAVMSREFNIQPGSPETGHLMSALLMAAMSKLAAMRTTAPMESAVADDTITKLMRGLFGNLLTIAGSGVRPLSMVWQLFGLNPQFDIPTSNTDWMWYETVVELYPYTGWPRAQFYSNLEKLLDKAIVRVVTKNENMEEVKLSRTAEMVKYCKLRNIQLEHSRTFVTIFMRMFTSDVEIRPIATRLLEQLPEKLEHQTESYTRMVRYLQHLAAGGARSANDDLIAASVYTKRSAEFSGVKSEVAAACKSNDWQATKAACKKLLKKHAAIAKLWEIEPGLLKVQNLKAYKDLLAAKPAGDIKLNGEKIRPVLDDAERNRVPWQVGKKGQFGVEIEPLDEAFMHEILTGGKPDIPAQGATSDADSGIVVGATSAVVVKKVEYDFAPYASSLQAGFVGTMQGQLSPGDVCELLKVPVSAMRVYMKALESQCEWENLGEAFKCVVLGLVMDRKNRLESRPVRKLFGLDGKKGKLLVEQ